MAMGQGRRRSSSLAAIGVVAIAIVFVLLSASAHATVWLCKPGPHPDPCTPGLSTTVYNSPLDQGAAGRAPEGREEPADRLLLRVPDGQGQKTGNANLQIDPEENSIALYQAARYSQYCKVYAPMYRQETLDGIGLGQADDEAECGRAAHRRRERVRDLPAASTTTVAGSC